MIYGYPTVVCFGRFLLFDFRSLILVEMMLKQTRSPSVWFCSRKMSIRMEYLFQCMIKVVAKCQLALNKLIQIQQVQIIVEIVVFRWHFSSRNLQVCTNPNEWENIPSRIPNFPHFRPSRTPEKPWQWYQLRIQQHRQQHNTQQQPPPPPLPLITFTRDKSFIHPINIIQQMHQITKFHST